MKTNKFPQNLKLLRQQEKISQDKLANLVGVTQQCISEWENGKIEPTLSFLWKLADIFNISVDELIGRIDQNLLKIIIFKLNQKKIGLKTKVYLFFNQE